MQSETILVSRRLIDHLLEMERRHADEPTSEAARRDAAAAVDMFAEDNGGLALGSGDSLPTEHMSVRRCADFSLSDLVRGKASRRPVQPFGEGAGEAFDHVATFKRGRKPIVAVSSPHASEVAPCTVIERNGYRIIRTGLPSWYMPGSCALDLIVADATSVRIED